MTLVSIIFILTTFSYDKIKVTKCEEQEISNDNRCMEKSCRISWT